MVACIASCAISVVKAMFVDDATVCVFTATKMNGSVFKSLTIGVF